MTDIGISKLAETLHPLEKEVLTPFYKNSQRSEEELWCDLPHLQRSQISMAIGWLQTKEIIKIVDEKKRESVLLTEIGLAYARKKNPPLRIANEIQQRQPFSIADLKRQSDLEPEEISSAIGALKEAGAIRLAPGGVFELIDRSKLSEFERLQEVIKHIYYLDLGLEEDGVDIATLSEPFQAIIAAYHRKRGKSKGIFRINERIDRTYAATERFSPLYQAMQEIEPSDKIGDEIGGLTPEMLKDGKWRGRKFRKYNLLLPPSRISGGRKHPYKSFLDQVKQKLVSMGFSEMRGPLVESEFWNMDALYMPQHHPAREIHDVYFVKSSLQGDDIPNNLLARVAACHQTGGASGSCGWRYPFDTRRTRRLILRSQGTAISARTLGGTPNIPGKYFSIARCFRYDQVDATHAPDFFQVEGIVLGPEIHFGILLGLLTLFAKEVARAKEIKFLPAYFPFTEPSVEMHVRHPKLGWMELGGAGLFRPEVTQPFGINVPVIAWGLGLDRMAMVALSISDIRDLFSPDLGLIRSQRIQYAHH